jgi:5-methylcytosine-specific restriction protein A
MRRPCLEPDCNQLAVRGSRCPTHTRAKDRARGSSTQRGYDYQYQQARAALLALNPRCHWCEDLATTADHLPSLKRLKASGIPRSEWSKHLVPACAFHNAQRGGQQR